MSVEYAVKFENVSKIYSLKTKKNKYRKFYALNKVSFNVNKGDVVGIIGSNGSGKSTLSSILAEISCADEGKVEINGDSALIAINAGFNNNLTGLENIKLKATLLGFSKKEIEKIIEGVIEFSEIGDFIYQPVKSYSSGMKSRLGFSICICINPDIIIVDEALSVGDKAFSEKCLSKFKEFKEQGKTIFFISHSLNQVKSFCDKGLWIEGGSLRKYGDVTTVIDEYLQHNNKIKELSIEEKAEHDKEIFESRLVTEENSYKKLIFNKYFFIAIILGSVIGYRLLMRIF